MSVRASTMSRRRNNTFTPGREPLHHDFLTTSTNTTNGPFSFLNPTQAHYNRKGKLTHDHSENINNHNATATGTTSDSDQAPTTDEIHDHALSDQVHPGVGYKWSSRNNRKGRHALTLTESAEADLSTTTPSLTSTPTEIFRGLYRMLVQYPVWDISFDVAYIFVWGSIIWVINAFFDVLPYTNPSTDFPGETLDGGGITAFIGATVFEIGSVLLMFEAVNENRSACFGWAIEELFDDDNNNTDSTANNGVRISPSKTCTHHHQNRHNLVGSASTQAINKPTPPERDGPSPSAHSWIWFPKFHELTSHYLRELGFIACSAQMFGATVFWISGFTALPGIYNHLPPRLITGIYWVPQIIGGSGFVVSGALFMLEVQRKWYTPAPGVLGWWIGLWNLAGGVGFTLCPIFGLMSATWAQEQAAVSTFWGSWAFLIGSCVQWYESLQKYPVERG